MQDAQAGLQQATIAARRAEEAELAAADAGKAEWTVIRAGVRDARCVCNTHSPAARLRTNTCSERWPTPCPLDEFAVPLRRTYAHKCAAFTQGWRRAGLPARATQLHTVLDEPWLASCPGSLLNPCAIAARQQAAQQLELRHLHEAAAHAGSSSTAGSAAAAAPHYLSTTCNQRVRQERICTSVFACTHTYTVLNQCRRVCV